MTVNVKIVMMQHLRCDFVVVLIQERLLLNIHIGYFSVQTSVPNKRHVIIQTSDVIIQTSVTTLSKQAPEPLYWQTLPDWYSSDIKKKRHKTNNNKTGKGAGFVNR